MSIPTVTNFDEAKIPVEGSADFRANASYVWGKIVDVIKSINASIAGINSTANDVETSKTATQTAEKNASNSATNAFTSANEAKAFRDTTEDYKNTVEGINNNISGAIATAIESQIGEYTAKIDKNARVLKAKDFGISL